MPSPLSTRDDPEAVEAEIRRRAGTLSLEAKVRLLSGQDHWSTYAEPAIGLRSIVVSDGTVGIRGVRWSEEHTSINTPSATAIAASFDPTMAHAAGVLIGDEARRKGVDVVLGPVVNLQRSPYNGRHFEAFSEDPVLTASIGAAMVAGIQERGPATTTKHFVGNEAETDRLNSDSVIDEQALREVYLTPFEEIVAAGGAGVMSAYNRVNGTSATDTDLLSDVLKGEWGFDGLVISDWGAIRSVVESGNGPTDLAMPGPRTRWAAGLVDAVRDGRVRQAAVDDKVLRLLRLAARVGALTGIDPLVDASQLPAAPVAEDAGIAARLRRLGAAGTVLLRNEPVNGKRLLPIDPTTISTIAVIGPVATAPRINGGGSAAVIPPPVLTPLDAIVTAFPDADVRYAEGARPATLISPLTARHGAARLGSRTGVVLVEFLAADGEVVGQELRDQCDTLIYGMGYPPGVPEERVARIRATTAISVDADGNYLLACAGVGHARVSIDGDVRVDETLTPINADAVVGMSLPPQAILHLALTAGKPINVTFEYTPAPRTVAALRLGFDAAAASDEDLLAAAVAVATGADLALVLVGSGPEDEAEGFDRSDLALGGRQDDLVRAVAAANPRTVVVVNAGAPVLLPWRSEVAAIVLPWFGGQEMSTSLVEVLTGIAEPGGRLPVTFPAVEGPPLASPVPVDGRVVYSEGLQIGYRAFARSGIEPAYAFGFGLGYTSWSLGSPTAQNTPEGVTVRVPVQNTGERAGRQIVQVYLSRPESTVNRPAIWFAGAAAATLSAGAEEVVEIRLPRRRFEHWDPAAHAWALESGAFRLAVGTSSERLSAEFDVVPH